MPKAKLCNKNDIRSDNRVTVDNLTSEEAFFDLAKRLKVSNDGIYIS